jgi:uncharacterized YccA/Bax inhibitor family protein
MAQLDESPSKNPILRRYTATYDPKQFAAMQQAAIKTGQPMPVLPTPVTDDAVTLPDVIMKTSLSLIVLIAAAVVGWNTLGTAFTSANNGSAILILIVCIFAALGVGIANTVMKQVQPLLVLLYSVLEGFAVGAISASVQHYYSSPNSTLGIVGNAVLATLIVFVVTLGLFASGLIRVTPRFQKMMIIGLVSYLILGVVSLVSALFGVGGGWGLYGLGPIGIVLCLLGVGLATMSLVLDFGAIQQAINYGVPERESWRFAYGITVTLVWLYLELLRLMAILQGR